MGKYTFYEFFAGGGMARAGLGNDWRCLFANDFDPKKTSVYKANWGGKELYEGDVAGVAPFQLHKRADLAWASFPCQDLSLAGAGAGLDGERSGSFWPFWGLMQQLRRERRAPRTIILENVCGLLTSNDGDDFVALSRALGNGGYRFGAMVIDAVHFVPQSRPRLFLIAFDQQSVSSFTHTNDEPSDFWHPPRLIEAYERLSSPLRSKWLWFDPPTPATRNTVLADLIEEHPVGVKWHSESETKKLIDMMSAVNKAKLDEALVKKKRIVGTIYKRTRWEGGEKVQRAEVRFDGVSGCLRTPGGGSSRQVIIVVESGEVRSRLISARETAYLMGLDESYRLPDKYNEAYHVTGDGVAVPVVSFLSETLIGPALATARVKQAA